MDYWHRNYVFGGDAFAAVVVFAAQFRSFVLFGIRFGAHQRDHLKKRIIACALVNC